MNTDTFNSGDMPGVVVILLVFIAVDVALTIARALSNNAVRERLDIHEQRLDTASAHRCSMCARLDQFNERLACLETDGK